MAKIRTFLNILLGQIRYNLARFRKWLSETCALSESHWRWAAYAILIIMGLFMGGMFMDFMGVLHPFIFLFALVFFLGLPLLSGLGVRLVLRILAPVPKKFSWIFFAIIFFVFFLFGFPVKARVVIAIFLLFAGTFFGAGLYNLTGGRWAMLTSARRGLTYFFAGFGLLLILFGMFFLFYPGKAAEEVKIWAMESTLLPAEIAIENPSRAGPFEIDSLTYGSGKDRHRKAFGLDAQLITPTVDGSNFLEGWEKLSGKLRSHYWDMRPDSLALNGRVWFPVGQGPFPLVLMVHGNHLDRDFSDNGYDYLGRQLASHEVIAVSVDENFLNGTWSDFLGKLKKENDCRAWLLLKHLEQWRDWNRDDSAFFYKRVDMDRIVLIGHSRGGEAVSIAACFNKLPFYPDNGEELFDFGFGIRGVAGIAPVDGQYNPAGVPTPLVDVNYFSIHGSMDGDLRSYDGIRQMRRVKFSGTEPHFAAGLYLHGANHGQFNRSWGRSDIGYPNKLMLNRRAIIPREEQEKVAVVYLTAFVLESMSPGMGYQPLFKDYRTGRHWLPELIYLNHFHESAAYILCDFEEDLDLGSGSRGITSITHSGLALWKEGRIPKKWGDQRNNGVFLGWNNEQDSVPGYYQLNLDRTYSKQLKKMNMLCFLAADAQMDPGERKNIEKKDDTGDEKLEEDPVPIDFTIVLTDTSTTEYRVKVGDFQKLQVPIKPKVYKSRLFWKDPESEVVLQYITIPMEAFRSADHAGIPGEAIHSIRFEFDGEKKGSIILDQIGFTASPNIY